jgi:hypothetical protein
MVEGGQKEKGSAVADAVSLFSETIQGASWRPTYVGLLYVCPQTVQSVDAVMF